MIRVIIYAALLPVFLYMLNYAHEKAHVEVFQRRNIKCKTKVGVVTPSYCESDKDTKETNMSNDVVDAVGYHILPVYYLIWFIGLMLVM